MTRDFVLVSTEHEDQYTYNIHTCGFFVHVQVVAVV